MRLKIISAILTTLLLGSCEEKPVAPVLSTRPLTDVTTTTAVSGGEITDDGGAAIISNGVCWNTSDKPTIDNNKTVESSASNTFSSTLSLLTPSTTYFVRAYATNSAGTSYGESVSFKTLGDKPASLAASALNVTVNSATLTGNVNPNLLLTTVSFEWGTTTNYGNTLVIPASPVNGSAPVDLIAELTGLTPGTTYHFRVKASNELGITNSDDMQFTTLGQVPSIANQNTNGITVNASTINGSVNPNYLSTTVSVEWGTSTEYGNTIFCSQSPITGSTPVSISANLSGLIPGTTYHYRISATNALGTSRGNDLTFKTLGNVPSVQTEATANLQYSSAMIKASVNPNYFSTTILFEWGTTTNYGNTIEALQGILTGKDFVTVYANLSGLVQGTTYHFRIVATNELGTTTSADLTFTTLAPITDIDGNTYNIKTIGTQIWMTENLKTTKYSDGTSISYGSYFPDNDISKVEKYGILYDWAAAIKQPPKYDTIMLDLQGLKVQGVCPINWHLPDETEWMQLIDLFGGKEVAGLKLKIANPGYWIEPLIIQEPLSGFNAIPAGMFYGVWSTVSGGEARYWTTNQWSMGGTIMGRSVTIFYNSPVININHTSSNNQPGSIGLSVRCIKD